MHVHFALAQLLPGFLHGEPSPRDIREEEEREIPAGQPARDAKGRAQSSGDELRLPLAFVVLVVVVVAVIMIVQVRAARDHAREPATRASEGGGRRVVRRVHAF